MDRPITPGNRPGNAVARRQAADQLLGRRMTVSDGLRIGRAHPRAVIAYVDLVGDLSRALAAAVCGGLFGADFRLFAIAPTTGEGQRIRHANGVGRQVLQFRGRLEDHPQVRIGCGQCRDVVGDDHNVAQVNLGQRPVEVHRRQDTAQPPGQPPVPLREHRHQRGYQDQGRGYPDQGQGGYPPSYEQRPQAPGGYGGQGYDQGYRQGGSYGPPGGGQPGGGGQQGYGGYGDYGRGPARQDEGGYAPQGAPEQPRPAYPDQGAGYDQGYQQGGQGYGQQDYGQQDYGQGDYTQYAEHIPGGGYAPPGGGYAEPASRDYDYGQSADYGQAADYGQQAGGGYGGYAQGGYGVAGTAVTLQLDDGSGRTYQLREGSNIVGRGQDAQFRLPDTGVSRRHLEIRWDGQVALLSDLNSTNGTTVNNAPVQEWQLADGDVIRLGHSEIIVRIH